VGLAVGMRTIFIHEYVDVDPRKVDAGA